jgi:protein-disulfide isomerase
MPDSADAPDGPTGPTQPALDVEPTDQGLPPAVYPAGRPPQAAGASTPTPVLPVVLALLLGLALGLIGGWLIPRPGSTPAPVAAAPAPAPTTTAAPSAPARLDPPAPQPLPGGPDGTEQTAGLVVGESGPLLEVFEDYVCPFCARFEATTGRQLREAAQAGQYRLVVHPIAFLTEDSPRAANASACVYQHADVATWIAFHEGLYAQQDPSERVGQFDTPVLLRLADETGAGSPAVTRCIEQGTYEQWVGALTQQAFDRGVRGTPTIALDGTLTEVPPPPPQ